MADKKKVKQIVSIIEDYLAEKGQTQELREIVEEFDNLLEKEEKQNTALVTTSYRLSLEEQRRVESVLTGIFDQDLDFEYQVEPSILGGIKIKIYDQIIDMTLDHTLQNISLKLKQ